MNTDSNLDHSLEQHVQELAHHLFLLRKMQAKADAELLVSLGKLSIQELNILNIIGESEPCIMSDIAKRAVLSLSSVTVIVDKLVKSKLVQRVRSEEDRRIVRGSLTPEGKQIYQVQIQHMQSVLSKMLNVLTTQEQKDFLSIFQKITSAWV
jgi:DNA-binding MarR family transcriptional regulator